MTDETTEPQASEDGLESAIDQTADAVAVQASELAELAEGAEGGEAMGLDRLLDVPVEVTVEVGSARITLGKLVTLGPGSLVTLDRESHEPADILVNGKVVARGEIVTVGESYGVRISKVEQ